MRGPKSKTHSEPVYSSLAEESYEKQYINYGVHKKKLRVKGAANKQITDKNIDAKCNVYKKNLNFEKNIKRQMQ